MSIEFEPGDQVEIAMGRYKGRLATVAYSGRYSVGVRQHFDDWSIGDYSLGYPPSGLRLIARYADLVAEDETQDGDPFNWLTTDAIDATQEAIDRVRASERQAAQFDYEPLADWERDLLMGAQMQTEALLGSVEPEPPVHAQILAEAEALLVGDRQEDYGPPEVNFRRIADVWDVLVPKPGGWAPADVALAMAGLKLARAAQGFKRDSAVDAAAYVALWAHLQKKAS